MVDLQNDFCSGGRLAVPDGEQVVAPINRISPLFRTVVATQDWHPPSHRSFASAHLGRHPYQTIDLHYGEQVLWPDHCVQGTPGAEFHPDLALTPATLILRKGVDPAVDSYSAFVENDHRTVTGLAGYLGDRGVRRVFVAGLAFDYCVLWSAEDARRFGFEVIVLEDACRALDVHGSVLQAVRRFEAAAAEFHQSSELSLAEDSE
jgi:nicotinamidase/pyrazinamidase